MEDSFVATGDSSPTDTFGNPALEAARAEYAKMLADPATRWDAQTNARADALYEKATAGKAAAPRLPPPDHVHTAPPLSVHIGQGGLSVGPVEPQPGETPDEAEIRARNEVILAPLKEEWGQNFDRRFAAGRAGLDRLFEDEGEARDYLGARIRTIYGPKGEAAALKFFADLEDLR